VEVGVQHNRVYRVTDIAYSGLAQRIGSNSATTEKKSVLASSVPMDVC